MTLSRRDLTLLLPALISGQTPSGAGAGLSQTFRNEDITPSRSGPLTSRQMLRTRTRSGLPLDLHESELPAGLAPHEPHRHLHEEMLLIREGALDVTIAGTTTRLGPGSSAYISSNQLHGWRNAGTITARYFVLAVGDDNA
jgi:mannose-6-phosphate isomerase-like protein (cupin superfamily)